MGPSQIGLKLDNSATVEIDNPIAPVTNSDEQGGILSVVMRNTETADCTIVISGGETTTTYTSEGLNPNIPITKYFWIKNGETVNSINVEKYTYTPFIADPSSPISVMRSDISNLTNLVTKSK